MAELARLIGQADPFGSGARQPPPHPLQSRANIRPQAYQAPAEQEELPPGPPAWMQRTRPEPQPQQPEFPEPNYQPAAAHPLQRYAGQYSAPSHHEDAAYSEADDPHDPSRYDDALYGPVEDEQDFQREAAYPDDPYAYQNAYGADEPAPRRRSNGLMTVAAVLTLAVVGTGAAFAYRTYVGSPRTGEPPIIKADNTPTKIVPPSADAGAKAPDRLPPADGIEKLVSREETPVDVTSKTGPRVVFPPLNQNGSPPSVASVTPSAPLASAANGTMPNSEPRKIKTLSVKGDSAEAGLPSTASSPAKPPRAAAAARSNPSLANASANGPLSLAPQAAPSEPPPTRVASTNPTAPTGGGGYVVQVSSQKNEAEAQASYRVLQNKYPSVLGGHSSLVKRVDLGEKGIYYRAFAGPFASADQASQVCNSLKAAGGQCYVQRN